MELNKLIRLWTVNRYQFSRREILVQIWQCVEHWMASLPRSVTCALVPDKPAQPSLPLALCTRYCPPLLGTRRKSNDPRGLEQTVTSGVLSNLQPTFVFAKQLYMRLAFLATTASPVSFVTRFADERSRELSALDSPSPGRDSTKVNICVEVPQEMKFGEKFEETMEIGEVNSVGFLLQDVT